MAFLWSLNFYAEFDASLQTNQRLLHTVCSKSEYVRCLHFTRENTLYVATNHGYLHHADLSDPENVRWTKLVQVSEVGPIICMDLQPSKSADLSTNIEDWIAIGDGKGNVTIIRVLAGVGTPKVVVSFTWSAGLERQLLGIYWCKSLGLK